VAGGGGIGTPPAAGPDPGLTIQVLGGFRVRVGDRLIPDAAWSRHKGAALVKLLALAPGHRLPREQAQEWLWPELGPAVAANNLHRTLYAVRRALHPPDGRPSCLHLADDGLRLRAAGPTWVDVDAFEAATAAARLPAGSIGAESTGAPRAPASIAAGPTPSSRRGAACRLREALAGPAMTPGCGGRRGAVGCAPGQPGRLSHGPVTGAAAAAGPDARAARPSRAPSSSTTEGGEGV
jgi:hypothetical protein